MTFVHFTGPTGRVVPIQKDKIADMREPFPGEMAPGVRTIIIMEGGSIHGIKEPMDVVEAKLS